MPEFITKFLLFVFIYGYLCRSWLYKGFYRKIKAYNGRNSENKETSHKNIYFFIPFLLALPAIPIFLFYLCNINPKYFLE